MSGLIQAEHEARYWWATSVVAGKDVLDAGCGVGYGARILAQGGAASVLGVDIAPDAIEQSKTRAGSIARFAVADLRSLGSPDRSFDVIVCFETIEHVDDSETVLDELRRVLRPEGVLALSTPNRAVHIPGNPHHVREYLPSELLSALERRFRNVTLYRQHPWVASLITDDGGFGTASSDVALNADVRKVVGASPGKEVFTLALAGDSDLPDPKGIAVLTEPIDLKNWHERAESLEDALRTLGREHDHALDTLAAAVAESHRLTAVVHAMERSISWRLTAPLRWAKARRPQAKSHERGPSA